MEYNPEPIEIRGEYCYKNFKPDCVKKLQSIIDEIYSNVTVTGYIYNIEKTWIIPVDKFGRQLCKKGEIKLT